jgi:glutamine synthetase adenylyltransferase
METDPVPPMYALQEDHVDLVARVREAEEDWRTVQQEVRDMRQQMRVQSQMLE